MNEFEYHALALESWSVVGSSVMDFVTILFAYSIAAHLAGDKLPRFFAWFLTLTYSFALLGPCWGIYKPITFVFALTEQYRIAYPDGWGFRGGTSHALILAVIFVPLLIGWLGSIAYMHWHVRRRE